MAAKKNKALDFRSRVIIGGIGGIAPLIISLLVVDVGSLINDIGMMDAVGLAVRCTVLVFIGALVGYLHNTEHEPFKIFQLGIAAPALLTTAINGYGVVGDSVSMREVRASYDGDTVSEPFRFSLIASAHAGTLPGTGSRSRKYLNASLFKEARVSSLERFFRGLIGYHISSKGDDWFVIVGSHKRAGDATAHAKRLASSRYLAKVYEPTGGSRYYAVVIGANLTLDEAQQLRKTAIKGGLPKDSYLWRK